MKRCLSSEFNYQNPDPNFLSEIIIKKYINFCPLYRQLYKKSQAGLDKEMMIKWIVDLSEKLFPIYEDINKQLLCSKRVFAGCLPIKHYSAEKNINKKYRVEIYIQDLQTAGFTLPSCIWLSYPVDWSCKKSKTNLDDFQGVLQIAYDSNFSSVFKGDKVTRAASMKSLLDKLINLDRVNSTSSIRKIITMIYDLYSIEESISRSPPSEKLKVRKEISLPKLLLMRDLLESKDNMINEKLCQGIINDWDEFSLFCHNGLVDIDNSVYNKIVDDLFPRFRNGHNLYFSDKRMGGAASIFYSLLDTCRINNIDPKQWLTYVIQQVPFVSKSDIQKLSPMRFKDTDS